MIALLPRLIFRKKLVFEINGLASEEQKLKGDSVLNSILVFLIKKTEKLATKYSDRIVAVTPQIASYLMTHFDCKPGKVEVVTNGVNTKKFYPIQDKGLLAEWRKRLGIAEEEMVVAFVGNLAPWQGVESLIQVAPTLLRNFDIRFLIIGNGILKNRLEASVNKLGISNNFIFTGMIDYKLIPLYINIADLCILLKRRLASGFSPIKVYEYMACGKPIVASRVEGLEFIEVEGIGRLVESEDITSIEAVLHDLLKNSQKRIVMGLRGHQLACQRFDWESKVAQIGKILEELA
jgi:glycosyltransferase involved in cell wall biosynthesis